MGRNGGPDDGAAVGRSDGPDDGAEVELLKYTCMQICRRTNTPIMIINLETKGLLTGGLADAVWGLKFIGTSIGSGVEARGARKGCVCRGGLPALGSAWCEASHP